MESKKLNNLSKRQQISASTRTVFLWVAGASIVASFSVVAAVFLLRQATFNEKVLAAKATTSRNLNSNIQTAKALRSNVNLLLSNSALNAVKTSADDSNLQVILDALPTSYDSANFGASLQGVLLNGSVASIDSLSVTASANPVSTGASTTGSADGPQPIPFTMTITGSADQIRTSLENMERSIRPIKITAITLTSGTPLSAQISGETYYLPSADLKLHDTVVKP